MKTSDILDIVSTKRITSRDLRKMTQQLQDAANKRVKRMMEDPIGRQSIVAARAQERIARGQSGYFTMEGVKTREQLRNRFQELQRFLGPDRPGSSLTQFKKRYKKIEEKKNISLLFRGSENQRLIDVPKSLKENTTILRES